MKWVDKGEELRVYQLQQPESEKFYVFGAGDIGRGLYVTLSHFQMFAGFIDNNVQKQDNGFCGQPVYSYRWYLENGKGGTLVIAANEANEAEISRQLQENNCKYYLSGIFLHKILPLLLFRKRELLFMNLAQICVTERCTLSCAKCAHGCWAVSKNAEDMKLEEVYVSADTLFSKIDYIHEFVLIGGEPLLYRHLKEAVEYIGEKYRDKMGTFSITTNGTVTPDLALLDCCKRHKVFFRISNYVKAVPALQGQYDKLDKILSEAGVGYYLGKAEEIWWDYGFSDTLQEESAEQLIQKFDQCMTPCREMRNGKLFYCVMARTVSDNLGYHIGEDDFLDLESLPEGDLGRRILLEYNLGYSEKGYLEMCAKCRGKDCRNYPVAAAEQLR